MEGSFASRSGSNALGRPRAEGIGVRWLWRLTTADLRALPSFLVIGAQRGGTSSLYYNLITHPSVVRAYRKEIHFFDRKFFQGIRWYRAHFPTTPVLWSIRQRTGAAVTGEASPYYLFHPAVPARVAELIPMARLVVLLRNPVDRAYSHYQLKRAKGHESVEFADAIEQEVSRLQNVVAATSPETAYLHPVFRYNSYLSRGRYAEQLQRWFTHFSRDRFLILKSEDFFNDPYGAFGSVLQFLGLSEWKPRTFRHANARRYPPLDPELRTRLTEYFRPHNQALAALLGEDFQWT